MATYDLIIAGGGPAGSSAAIAASRAGARVLLLERGRFPRHKVCGEFVSAESLHLLSSLLAPCCESVLRGVIRIPQARVFLDGRMLQTPVDPPASSIARFDLDRALWQAAEACGVQTRLQTTVRSIIGHGPFQVSTSAGDFETRAMIDATGRWSNLRTADNGKVRKKWLGLKAHFSESASPRSVDLYFFGGGYCGVQPVGEERINVCAMVRVDVASTLAETFSQHRQLEERSHGWQPLTEAVTTSPLVFREPEPEKDGVLHAGDAAGFVDPFVGDGISLALRSGALAAQSLIPFFRRELSLQKAVRSYREAYRHHLLPVFRASSKIRRLLLLPRALRLPLLYLLETTPALPRTLVRSTR